MTMSSPDQPQRHQTQHQSSIPPRQPLTSPLTVDPHQHLQHHNIHQGDHHVLQFSSPKLVASSVDNNVNVNGRLIPSSSAISLLSLGNTPDSPGIGHTANSSSNNYTPYHLAKGASDESADQYQDDDAGKEDAGNSNYAPPPHTQSPSEQPLFSPKRNPNPISTTSLRGQNAISQQRHKYYRANSGLSSSPNISRLSAQLKSNLLSPKNSSTHLSGAAAAATTATAAGTANRSASPTGKLSNANSPVYKAKGSPRVLGRRAMASFEGVTESSESLVDDDTDDAPDSPHLEPTSFSNSPSKFWFHIRRGSCSNSIDDLPRNISHLSLSGLSGNANAFNSGSYTERNSLSRQISASRVPTFPEYTAARPKNINIGPAPTFKGDESPVLRPVQTPGSEICMTPLALSYKNNNEFFPNMKLPAGLYSANVNLTTSESEQQHDGAQGNEPGSQ